MPGRVSAAPHQRQQRGQQNHVGCQRDIGDQAEHLVVHRHEHERGRHAEHHRLDALVDVVLAQARADGAFLHRRQRRRQTAGAQQQCQLAAFDRIDAGNREIVAEHAADRGAVDDFFGGACRPRRPCAFFSRERSMNTTAIRWPRFSWVFFSIFAAPRLSNPTDTAGTVLAIRLEGGIGQLIAGHHHVALQQHRLLFAGVEQLRTQRHAPGAGRLERIVGLIDHAKFQGCRLAENFLHFRRIL